MNESMRAALELSIREHYRHGGGRLTERHLAMMIDEMEAKRGQGVPVSVLWRALEIATEEGTGESGVRTQNAERAGT